MCKSVYQLNPLAGRFSQQEAKKPSVTSVSSSDCGDPQPARHCSILKYVAAAFAFGQMAATAHAQIFVAEAYNNSSGPGLIGEYATSGGAINASLVSGIVEPSGIALDGSGNVFVANPVCLGSA